MIFKFIIVLKKCCRVDKIELLLCYSCLFCGLSQFLIIIEMYFLIQFIYYDRHQILLINMSEGRVRKSTITQLPEQFVTIQIHNNMEKKKQRHHRQSLFNQMKMTETLIEESINKKKSAFNKENGSKSNFEIKKNEVKKMKKKTYLSKEIKLKFRQISNISKCFELACKNKPRQPFQRNLLLENQNIRKLTQPDLEFQSCLPSEKQQKHVLNQLKEKLKTSKDYILEKKDNFRNNLLNQYRIKSIYQKSNKDLDPVNNTDIGLLTSKTNNQAQEQVIMDSNYTRSYFQKYRNDDDPHLSKKPWQITKNPFARSLQKLNKNRKKQGICTENARKLHRFVLGGYEQSNDEFSDYFKLSQFLEARTNFKTLENIYNNIKDSAQNPIKEIDLQRMEEPNMLAVISYIENQARLDQYQKNIFKKRLKLID